MGRRRDWETVKMYNLKKISYEHHRKTDKKCGSPHPVKWKTSSQFSIATNDNYRNKQGRRIEQTTYFECAYWISPKVAGFLTKGTLVELNGKAYISASLGKEGEPHAGLNFRTSKIKVHSSRKRIENNSTDSIKNVKKETSQSKSKDSDKVTSHFKTIKHSFLTSKF